MKPFVCQGCQSWFECQGITWKFCMHINTENVVELEKAVISELDRKIRNRQIQGDHYHAQKLIDFRNNFCLRQLEDIEERK